MKRDSVIKYSALLFVTTACFFFLWNSGKINVKKTDYKKEDILGQSYSGVDSLNFKDLEIETSVGSLSVEFFSDSMSPFRDLMPDSPHEGYFHLQNIHFLYKPFRKKMVLEQIRLTHPCFLKFKMHNRTVFASVSDLSSFGESFPGSFAGKVGVAGRFRNNMTYLRINNTDSESPVNHMLLCFNSTGDLVALRFIMRVDP